MVSHRLFDELLLFGLLWLCVLLYGVWQRSRVALGQSIPKRGKRATRRSQETKPFPGLMHKPHCPACEHAAEPTPRPPASPPLLIVSTQGCSRKVDVQHQFCPNPDCAYSGWVGRGGATCAPMAIRGVADGGNGTAPGASHLFSRRAARYFMARACHPRGSCGPWGHWRKAWASARSPACVRSTPIPCCNGSSKLPTISRPSRSTSCMTYRSTRCSLMNSLPGSG